LLSARDVLSSPKMQARINALMGDAVPAVPPTLANSLDTSKLRAEMENYL
jgi:hypothetical protein